VRYQSAQARPNDIYLFYALLFAVNPHKIRNVFKDLRGDDLRAQTFAADYVIRAFVL